MSITELILLIIVAVAVVLILSLIASVIMTMMCDECPYRKECDLRRNDKYFTPPCVRNLNGNDKPLGMI